MADAAPAAPLEAADFDWGTWDRLPFNDEPNEQPPDPKRPKWGGPCAGKGPDGKGCHARWWSHANDVTAHRRVRVNLLL